jgi:hypothetical protein
VENRSEPQGWLADGSPGSTGSTKDAENAAGVQTVPPLFGMGPAASTPAEPEQASAPAPDDAPAPSLDDHQHAWAPRIPDPPPLSGNGTTGSSTTTVPASNWPPSPASGQSQGPDVMGPGAPPLGGPGAPPLSGRYSPPDTPRDFSAGTATFPKTPKGKIRPPRPAKSSRPSKRSSRDWSSTPGLPNQGAASSRKAQLAIARIEPWSVMKFSFMISLVGWVILFVAVAVMYFVLKKIGVFTSIEHTVGLVTSTKEHAGANAASWFSASRVLGYTMLVGAVNVILITALATVGAVLYNLVTMIAGGVEVTLKEAE